MVIYAIAGALCLFSGILGLVASALAFKRKPWSYRRLAVAHIIVALFAAIVVFTGTTALTIIIHKSANVINELSETTSITASIGSEFLKISWAASTLILVLCFPLLILFYRHQTRAMFATQY